MVLTASAPTAGVLIAARLFDGVQGAATGAASMALVLQEFSHEDRVKAMGWWALVGAGGPVLGVTIGAPIIQFYGWRALFWGELPLMAAAAVLAVVVLPSHDRAGGTADSVPGSSAGRVAEPSPGAGSGAGSGDVPDVPGEPVGPWRQLDWAGSATLSVSVTLGLLGLNVAPSWGFTSTETLALFALGLAVGVYFVLHERTAPRPLVPLRYFRKRNFVFPLGARAFVNFAYMGGFFLFPILMERIYGYSETAAGLLSTARPLMFSLSAPIAGYAAVKVGERWSVVAGSAALFVSMLVFTQVGADPSVVLIIVALALSGLANGVSTPSTASSASNEVAPDELGVMSAAQLLITQIGVVAGIQAMVTVQASSHGGAGDLASFHTGLPGGRRGGAGRAGVRVLRQGHAPGHPGSPRRGRPPLGRAHRSGGPPAAGGGGSGGDLLGHGLDPRGDLGRGRVRGRALEGHELGDVPLDLDLALHEGLQAGLGVALHQQGPGDVVADGHLEVDRVQVPDVEDQLARAVSAWAWTAPSPKGTSTTTRFIRTACSMPPPRPSYSARMARASSSHSSLRNR